MGEKLAWSEVDPTELVPVVDVVPWLELISCTAYIAES
jgi:hypothetical protein